MSKNANSGRQYPKDEAGRLMKRADSAFSRGRMLGAFNLYNAAVAHLETLWDSTQNAEIGKRLSDAYTFNCYPAWRKAFARGTSNKSQWMNVALDLERQGVDLGLHLAFKPVPMTDQDVLGVICTAHNFAGELIRQKRDFDGAERYIDETYRMLTAQRPDDDEMPKSLHFGFEQMRAEIALSRKEFAKALSLIDPVIANEQARVDKARRKHKQLPPPNWLKIPTEIRDRINKAIMDAAIETVRNAKI
jgi:hypothetical protein